MTKRRKLPRVVVDTNVLVSGSIFRGGIPYQVLLAWRNGAFTLLLSDEQKAELDDVLHRPQIGRKYGLSEEAINDLFFLLETAATKVTTTRRVPLQVRDPKDEKILAAALGGKADYLVTGDDDLRVLRGDPRLGQLEITTAREFLEMLGVEPPVS